MMSPHRVEMMAHLRIDLTFKSGAKDQVKVPFLDSEDHGDPALEMAEMLSKASAVWLKTTDGASVFIRSEDLSMAKVFPIS